MSKEDGIRTGAYRLPSLFGTLLANNLIRQTKISLIGVPLGMFLTWGNSVGMLNFLPGSSRTAVVMVATILGTILLSFALFYRNNDSEEEKKETK